MKYRLLNNYTINFSRLTLKLTVSAGIAGTFMLSSQPAQAVNQLSEDKVSPVSLMKPDWLKTVLRNYDDFWLEDKFLNPELIAQSLPSKDSVSQEKSGITKIPKKISTIETTFEEDNNRSKTTILLQSNLKTEATKIIPELPTLEIAENYSPKKSPKQIHIVRSGETISGIARKYQISDRELIKANNITNPNQINVDDELILPVEDAENKVVSDNLIVGSSIQSKSSSNSDLDPYISRLRRDVVKLRTQYQTQVTDNETQDSPTTTDLTYSSESDELVPTSYPTAARIEDEKYSESLISVVPDNTGYDEMLELPSLNSITPELPPLSSPEQYLPNHDNSFDGYIWPAQGTFTSGYGWRWGRMHKGIDIAAPIGTPIVAAASGEVVSAGWNSGGYGNLVKLKHSDGSITLYAHNNRIYVRKGQKITQGQQIAEMGSTGFSTGPHLHFEIRLNGTVSVNPIAYLSGKR